MMWLTASIIQIEMMMPLGIMGLFSVEMSVKNDAEGWK
jgi:hypothetical protein